MGKAMKEEELANRRDAFLNSKRASASPSNMESNSSEMEEMHRVCDEFALHSTLLRELDQMIEQQQLILQQAGLPHFFLSRKPDEIANQAQILQLILSLNSPSVSGTQNQQT
jgi:hypothetical protein